jgi:hypothetical protein
MNTKIEKYIENLSNTPDTSFSDKRKLIKKYQWDPSTNIEITPWYTPYIEYLDKISHVPSEVMIHIENVLDTNRSKKTFDATKVFKQIIRKIDNVEYDNLYYKNQATKILSHNSNNKEFERHYKYNHPKKSFQDATSYATMFKNNDGSLVSRKWIYSAIYKYCKMVENNVSMYNRYQWWESSFELFINLFPKYKTIDFWDHKRDDMVSISLSSSWILIIRLHAPVMSKINNFDSIMRSWMASFEEDRGVIVCRDYHQEKFFKMLNLNWDATDTTEHELQHIYNKFYKIDEYNDSQLLSDIYTRAKDEILAQLKGWANNIQTIEIMSNWYDYFSKLTKNKRYMQKINDRIENKNSLISKLQELKAPEEYLKFEQDRLNRIMYEKDILTNPTIQDTEKKKYLENIKTYILEAYKFISRAEKEWLIYDPYVILASTQMKDRSNINKKIWIEK